MAWHDGDMVPEFVLVEHFDDFIVGPESYPGVAPLDGHHEFIGFDDTQFPTRVCGPS